LEEHGIRLIIRGLRAVSDYEYEIQLFLANKYLNSQVETVLMPTSLRYQFVSSSLVKEMVSFGLDVSEFVTPTVERALKNAGSSSLKFQLFDMEDESVMAKGIVERIGLDKPFLSYSKGTDKIKFDAVGFGHAHLT